ncbi:hypothetical protein Pmani_031546 [Petrolisthes manimaculis]|uniref:TIR domain-containing protein n=1 Tax=Petrolisthes manimaculis TaxID=1843537 RepID=A0AAE1NTG8_9EUCA|nr:hypothetical protein Pmani_031546 [Petrolisthes manimaculis]
MPPTTSLPTHTVALRLSVMLVVVLLVGGVGGRPPECEWDLETTGVTAGSGDRFRTTCHVRTLTPSLMTEGGANASLSALPLATHITVLSLHCNKQLVFESKVTAGMFSVFPGLEDLQILGCKVTNLPANALAGLPHLRRLTLRAHHEDWPNAALTVHQDSLADLGRLEALDLSHNALWLLPRRILCRLPFLKSLNLTHNRLHHLPDLGLGPGEGQSCSLPLHHLDLSHNQVAEVPEKAFSDARELQTLSLRHNRLAHLDDFAFSGLYVLKRLDLSHNKLVAVPRSALSDLQQLLELRLANNSLSVLPPDAFKSLGQLQTLDISYNQLSLGATSSQTFAGLIRLMVLDASHNMLAQLEPNTFTDLYGLQDLRLAYNRLSYLADDTFASLANLHRLQLSHNQLTEVSGRALQGLAVLIHLSLDHNQLISLSDAALSNCSSLRHLNLAHNQLEEIPTAITRARLLRTLNLSHNQISEMEEGALQGLIHLREFWMAHNLITNITKAALTGIPALRYIDFSYNLLADVEYGALQVTPLLEGVTLHHNRLEDLNGVIIELKNLTWLNASHNDITWFDYALVPKNLEWLDISYNLIDRLDNFYKVQQDVGLKVLYASYNNISDISSPAIPDSIHEVHLDHNSISYVASNTFLDKTTISLIDLRHNSLSILEEAALRLSPRQAPPPLLLLSHNPLQCDCAADWLLRAAGAGPGTNVGAGSILPHLGDVGSVKCRLPGLWQEAVVPLVTVQPQQFLCTYRRHCFTLCHCCDFDACDCEQTCPQSCTCYHDHTWTHNVVDCGGGWAHMPLGVPMDVTEAFMDGNKMGPLTSHALIGRKNLKVLHLNHSEITIIQNRTFNGLRNLQVLRLDHNLIEVLFGYEFVALHDLRELYLNNNRLRHLSNVTFSSLRAIEALRMDHNQIATFPVWNLALNPFLVDVSLYHNPWSCECSYLANLRAWLEENRIKAVNASLIRCWHNNTGSLGPPVLSDTPVRCDHYVATTKINSLIIHDYVMLLFFTAALILLLLAAAIIVFAYRRRLKLWAVSRYGKRLFEKSSAYVEEREKLFDAFVTHSAKDSTWVCGLLAPELEASGYRLCVAHRDCAAPSAPVAGRAIAESITCSRRVLVVLSRGLVDAEWCRYDFKSAHVEALRGVRHRHLVVVVLEDVPRSELDSELSAIIRAAATTLYPRDPRFWEKLRRTMPSLRSRRRPPRPSTMGNKAVSKPLVAAEHQTGPPWPLPETKSLGRPSAKSLTVNPYWETAVGTGPAEAAWAAQGGPDLGAPPWVHTPTKQSTSPAPSQEGREGASSPAGSCRDPDHTYMSVSECGEVRAALLPPTTLPPPVSRPPDTSTVGGREGGGSRTIGPQLFRRDAPDYLTRSWIFHQPPSEQPPPPGQTYFV